MDLDIIQNEIQLEKSIMKKCDCCMVETSILLFIPRKNGCWGIFHLCLFCWSKMVNPKPDYKFYTVYK